MAGHDDNRQHLLPGQRWDKSPSYGSFDSGRMQNGNSWGSSSSSTAVRIQTDTYSHNFGNDDDDNNDHNGGHDIDFDIDLEMNYPLEKRPGMPLSPSTTTKSCLEPNTGTSYHRATTSMEILTSIIPGISWIRNYHISSIIPDLMGALTVASLYIPLAFSFASVANVPPASSLYAFVFHPPVYALLGTCPLMVIGPEATGSLLVGAAIHALNPGSGTAIDGGSSADTITASEANALVAGAATALAGAILLAMGFLRLGFLDNVLSRPLMKGFICGVGVVLVVKQAVPGLGLQDVLAEVAAGEGGNGSDAPSSGRGTASALDILLSLLGNVAQVDGLAAAFSVCTLGFVLVCAHIKKSFAKQLPNIVYFPDRFVAIVASAVVVYLFDLEAQGLDIVGASGSSRPGLPSFNARLVTDVDRLKSVANTALMIAMLGYFESSVTGKSIRRPVAPVADDESRQNPQCARLGKDKAKQQSAPSTTLHRRQPPRQKQQQQQHSADRELVALGTANVLGGLFSTLPAFGGFGRSKLNLQAGSQTPMSGIFLSLITFLAILFVTPFLYYVPRATLAAMSCAVGIAMVEECAHDAVFFVRARAWREVALMALVSGVIFVKGMDVGVVVGLGATVLLLVKTASAVSVDIMAGDSGGEARTSRRRATHDRAAASGIAPSLPPQSLLNQQASDCDIEDRIAVTLRIQESLTFINSAALIAGIDQALNSIGNVTKVDRPRAALVVDMLRVRRIDSCCGQLLVEVLEQHVSTGVVVVVVCGAESESVLRTLKRCGLLDVRTGVRMASDYDEARAMIEDINVSERSVVRSMSSVS
ncbi:solute carrier family 26 (sodium-independent sulfate anion transporter) member 11 [Microdochium nivale]|nr:solute carrier family 26 (sodium-independent sulfate anion transporter) member 11 [Microdochium nivale]